MTLDGCRNMSTRDQQILAHFCNHLIAIIFNFTVGDDESSEARSHIWSATYIEIDGRFFFLTGGHCIRQFEAARNGCLSEFTCYIDDGAGSKAEFQSAIPFDYLGAVKYAYDEGHLDYGLIEVRESYQQLLTANKIEAIREVHWAKQRDIDFLGYALLGIPAETTHALASRPGEIYAQFEPTLIFLRKTAQSGERRFTTFLPEDRAISSVQGMSGGPIIGFAERNGLRYWLFAIQSSWIESSGQIFATWLPDIIEHFRETLRGAI